MNLAPLQQQMALSKVEDSPAPLDFISKNGYFLANNKVFAHKISALQELTRSRKTFNDLRWIFNPTEFQSINWKQKLGVPLTHLYRMRAEQLRQKYDYLMLLFSGGGDSSNVLDSFIMNNIHVDEVVVCWPLKQTQNRYKANTDPSPTNMPSEWDYAILPKLKWLEKNRPKIKITVLDHMAEIDYHEDRDDTAFIVAHHTYPAIQRWRMIDDLMLERQNMFPNLAAIVGADRPFIIIVENYLVALFADMVGGGYRSIYTAKGLRRNVEYFYWTPDMPELYREQAHAVYEYLITHPEFQKYIPKYHFKQQVKLTRVDDPSNDYYNGEIYRKIIKPLIYPTYDPNTFQVFKPKGYIIKSEHWKWFHDIPESSKILEPWMSAINAHQALIDDQYITRNENNEIVGYKPCTTGFYPIGKIQ